MFSSFAPAHSGALSPSPPFPPQSFTDLEMRLGRCLERTKLDSDGQSAILAWSLLIILFDYGS